MINRNKKIFIIIASITVLIVIIGIILGVLYINTDFLKSNSVLFSKYMTQNVETYNELQTTTISSVYENIKNNDKYESNTNVKVEYAEGGDVSNPINNLKIKINSQKDEENKYKYTDTQLLFKDEEYLRVELIKEEDKYGIRFSDVVKQFLTIKEDENLQAVADDIGIDIKVLYDFVDMLNGKDIIGEKISGEEIRALQNTYLNMLMQNMNKVGTYSKLKNAMITVNNQTIETNAYSINLTNEQVKSIIIEMLNNIKEDEVINKFLKEISILEQTADSKDKFAEMVDNIIKKVEEKEQIGDLKITVYEANGITIRTSIEIGVNNILIDNLSQEGQIKLNIQNNVLNSEKVNQQNIEITKLKNENQETYNMIINILNGDETQTINISNDLQSSDSSVKMNTKISSVKDIITTSLILDNEIKVTDAIQKNIKLDEKNNIVLNDLEQETRKNILNIVRENTIKKFEDRIELLKKQLGLIIEEPVEGQENVEGNTMSQIDVNRFNAKFEFYTGDTVTSENVKALLNEVKFNVKSVEFPNIVTEGQGLTENNFQNIKLNIEKDTENVELINTVLEKIKNNKKYKVQISYKDENGMIDYITIVEVK